MSATTVKIYVESNLNGLYGSTSEVKIDKVDVNNDTFDISGTFYVSWEGTYRFKMVIDSKGNLKSFSREKAKD